MKYLRITKMGKYIIILLIVFVCTSMGGYAQSVPSTDPYTPTQKILKLYPNPASSVITFESKSTEAQKYSIQIFNFFGTMIADIPFVNKKVRISLTNYNRGVYIYRVHSLSGAVLEIGKFQISKSVSYTHLTLPTNREV